MKQAKCFTCDKITHNLLTANCNHKICFNCVKNNRNTHKCSQCAMSGSKNKLHALSPARKQLLDKERQRTTKTKSIESHRYHEDPSPLMDRSTRRSQVHIQSCSNYIESSTQQDLRTEVKLLCKEHHEPLTLFSKSSKQAICSTCLCSKPKYKEEIMPIKNAQDFLKKENHIQRQESRMILGNIEKSHRLMKVNFQQFQLYYGSHIKIIGEIFGQLRKQLDEKERQVKSVVDQFFVKKLKECQEIEQDLSYLKETLQTYREENKETNSLTQSLYVYSSFKVIKQTMKTLNLDYISYANKNVSLLEYNKEKFDSALVGLVKFSEQLPLKHEDMQNQAKKRGHSASMSRQKPSYSNSHKKESIYENLLNDRMNLRNDQERKSISRNIESAKKHIQSLYRQQQQELSQHHNGASKSHNNSLSTHIHQNLQKQRPKHNNSTSSYFNNNRSGSKAHPQSHLASSNVFDYELKTPIKHLLTNADNLSSSKKQKTPEHVIQEFARHSLERQSTERHPKRPIEQSVLSSSSISGLEMNEEERSLYKRLLKSRFTKANQERQQHQNERDKQSENQREIVEAREKNVGEDGYHQDLENLQG